MSHELRTPLNAIIGFSDVLEQRMYGTLNDQQSDYVRDIAESGRHLLHLVNEILDLSKVEAGRMQLESSEFALSETIRGTLSFVRERAAGHGIALTNDVPADLGTIVADERKIRQVLLNLLSNAVKFTPDGGTIAVRARRGDGEVEVAVQDTGIGIAPRTRPRCVRRVPAGRHGQRPLPGGDRARADLGQAVHRAPRRADLGRERDRQRDDVHVRDARGDGGRSGVGERHSRRLRCSRTWAPARRPRRERPYTKRPFRGRT